jgi:aminoglycoside phosphotransferase (APT) family kinase protein
MRTKPGPAAKLLPSAHAIEREFRSCRPWRAATCRCPAWQLLCEDESVIGRAFYVMDCVDGRVLWDQSCPA